MSVKGYLPEIPWHNGTNLHNNEPNNHRFTNANTGVIGSAVMHSNWNSANLVTKYIRTSIK